MIVSRKLDTAFISVPEYYDTSFSWHDTSGCWSSSELRFRFQQKKLEAAKENCNGYPQPSLWKYTVDRITVSYSQAPYLIKGFSFDSLKFYSFHLQRIEEAMGSDVSFTIPFNTVKNVNGRLYSIILITDYNRDSTKFSKKLCATSIINEKIVSLTYEVINSNANLSNEKFLSITLYHLTHSNPGNGM